MVGFPEDFLGVGGISRDITISRQGIIREYHQAVVLIPVHLTGSIRRIVRYQRWITVGIIGIMVVTNLRWSRRMVTVLILISKVITLGCVVVTTNKLPLQPLEF